MAPSRRGGCLKSQTFPSENQGFALGREGYVFGATTHRQDWNCRMTNGTAPRLLKTRHDVTRRRLQNTQDLTIISEQPCREPQDRQYVTLTPQKQNVHILIHQNLFKLLYQKMNISTGRSSIRTSPRSWMSTKWMIPFSAFLSLRMAAAKDSVGNGQDVGKPQRVKSC